MAYLHCGADGDWTAAGTWQLVNATGVTLLDSQVNNSVLTTAYVSSAAFTPGAITIFTAIPSIVMAPGVNAALET